PVAKATAAAAVPAQRAAGMHPARADAGERLSPVVRKLLAEHTLDPNSIAGTGRDGRITRDDVLAHIERGGAGLTARTEERPPYAVGGAGIETIALNNVRKRTAEHM